MAIGRIGLSKGVLLYHLLTGVSPFKKKFRASMEYAITNEKPVLDKTLMSSPARDLINKLI